MTAGKVAHATLKGPSVVKEICIGIALGLAAGGLWKMHHWNEQRKVRTFYDLLEKGEISVVVDESDRYNVVQEAVSITQLIISFCTIYNLSEVSNKKECRKPIEV